MSANGEALPKDDQLLTTDDFCELLSISRETAERWRSQGGDYPPFIRLGGGRRSPIRYSKKAVLAWVAAHQRHSTSECGDQQ